MRSICLAALLLLSAVVIAAGQEYKNFTTANGVRIVFPNNGRAARFKVLTNATSNEYFEIRLGKIVEVDQNQRPVPSRAGGEIASLPANFTQGNETIDGHNVSFVALTLPINHLAKGLNSSYPPPPRPPPARKLLADAANVTGPAPADAFVRFKVYFPSQNTTFPYGVGNNVTVAANSVKFNIEAAKWPFCSPNNTLALDILMKTSRGNESAPMMYNSTNVEVSDADLPLSAPGDNTTTTTNATTNVTTTSSMRKMLEGPKNTAAAAAIKDCVTAAAAAPNGSTIAAAGDGGNATKGTQGPPDGKGPDSKGPPDGKGPNRKLSAKDDGPVDCVKPRRAEFPEQPPKGQAARMEREHSKMAKFLISASTAASLNLQTYAYEAANGTVKSNVTLLMRAPEGGEDSEGTTRVTAVFPAFQTLYWDPDLQLESSADAGYNTTAISNTTSTTTTTTTTGNSASSLSASTLLALVVAGVAAWMV